jgi:hypothetical protein
MSNLFLEIKNHVNSLTEVQAKLELVGSLCDLVYEASLDSFQEVQESISQYPKAIKKVQDLEDIDPDDPDTDDSDG